MDFWIILLRFAIVFIFAIVFGLERQKAHKPIGFGAYVFVSVGACGLSIAATILTPENPLPLLSAIITGIGFLGAGALIKTTDKIFGFTSAASIWIFAILGLVIGIGNYFIGSILYVLVWFVIIVDKKLEREGTGSYQKKLVITANRSVDSEELIVLLRTRKYKITSIDINRKTNQYCIHLLVEGSKLNLNQLPKRMFKAEWIEAFKIE